MLRKVAFEIGSFSVLKVCKSLGENIPNSCCFFFLGMIFTHFMYSSNKASSFPKNVTKNDANNETIVRPNSTAFPIVGFRYSRKTTNGDKTNKCMSQVMYQDWIMH